MIIQVNVGKIHNMAMQFWIQKKAKSAIPKAQFLWVTHKCEYTYGEGIIVIVILVILLS